MMTLQTLMATFLRDDLARKGHTLSLAECEAIIGSILIRTAELAAIAGEALAAVPRVVVNNGDKPQ